MADLRIDIEGVDKAISDLKLTELRKRGRLIGAVALTALAGETMMKRMLSQPGTGIWYGNHRASSPGSPPATDTGRYRASWRHSVHSKGLGADLFTDVEYGPHLEFGTRNMAPRPHAGPVSEKLRVVWIANAKKALD